MGSSERQRVLVVDDEPGIREALQIVLGSEGYEVVTASSCKEALDACARVLPEIVICDILMPERDGLETIKDLRISHPGLRIVAMTGGGEYGLYDLSAVARHLGADRALLKPFDSEDLLECVRELLAGRA
jgi:CheY-like chemotaxis protein